MAENKAYCAHLKVVYKRIDNPNGTCSDSWVCASDCKTQFAPRGDDSRDQEVADLKARAEKAEANFETASVLVYDLTCERNEARAACAEMGEALKTADDALATWFSSEYCESDVAKKVRKVRSNPGALLLEELKVLRNTVKDLQQSREAAKRAAFDCGLEQGEYKSGRW